MSQPLDQAAAIRIEERITAMAKERGFVAPEVRIITSRYDSVVRMRIPLRYWRAHFSFKWRGQVGEVDWQFTPQFLTDAAGDVVAYMAEKCFEKAEKMIREAT